MNDRQIKAALEVFSEKWKPIIIYHLIHEGKKRYSEIQRLVPEINKRMLTLRLKELEEDKIINRIAYLEIPPRVEYEITDYGVTLKPVLILMNEWGEMHAKEKEIGLPLEDNPGNVCFAMTTMETIDGKWKPLIIMHLLKDTFRFNELLKRIPTTKRTLSVHLKELEEEKIIKRKVYNEVPPRVEYSITEYGKTLEPLLREISEWGNKHFD